MHFKPKKSLGQNFLIDKNIQRKIIESCNFSYSDTVLEIGAGRGELTGQITSRINRLYSLEIDKFLYGELCKKFKSYPNAKIINKDILKFDIEKYFKNLQGKIKVVGNIPYNISSPIIEHLVEARKKIKIIFLTVQKEFALRIQAVPGNKDYGSFSCFVQYYFDPKIIFIIKKASFYPSPKVDSAFINLTVRDEPRVNVFDDEKFFKIIRSSFGKRRKMLKNALAGIVSQDTLNHFFASFGINPKARAEELSLQDFANLANI